MDEMKHTPGPWWWNDGQLVDEEGHYILMARPQRASVNPIPIDATDADHLLIAAAPELLEALEEYMSEFGQALEAHDILFGPAQLGADLRARAAIAKARGQS